MKSALLVTASSSASSSSSSSTSASLAVSGRGRRPRHPRYPTGIVSNFGQRAVGRTKSLCFVGVSVLFFLLDRTDGDEATQRNTRTFRLFVFMIIIMRFGVGELGPSFTDVVDAERRGAIT